MSWVYLILAGIFEIGWPVGLKLAQSPQTRFSGIALAAVCILISGALLWLSQRTISIGTAYAIWTGIGAAGTFVVGVVFFADAFTLMRSFGVLLIIAGVVTLKLAS